jgi:tripartite ATP-independent transporter DctP family solute receptor
MRTTFKLTILSALILALLVPASVFATGQAEPAQQTYVLKFGHLANEQNPWHLAALRFKEVVEQRSNGRIRVDVFPSEQLGNEMDTVTGIQAGTAHMTITGESLQNWAPLAALLGVPYAIRDLEHLDKVAQGAIGDQIEAQIIEKVGIRPIAYFARGPRNLTSNRPIRTPDDLDGMVLRVPNVPMYVDVWRALGANPTPMAFSEVFTSLQQGTIDGQENPYSLIRSASFFEVQDYVNLTEHVRGFIYVVIGEEVFQSMPADLQQIVIEAGQEMQRYEREIFMAEETKLERELQDLGMELVQVDKAAFQRRAEAAIRGALNAEQFAVYQQIVNLR